MASSRPWQELRPISTRGQYWQMIPSEDVKTLKDFERELAAIEESASGLGHRVAAAHAARSLLGFQAEWHIRGIVYHLRRLSEKYAGFAGEVSARASTGARVIVMYSPTFQEMLFEFYALVNLCRIALDNLRIYLNPLFTRTSDQLPKSIRDVLNGSTNCPIYTTLRGEVLLYYLLDLRNCLVHYRSFATSDNACVLEEGADTAKLVEDDDTYFKAMARGEFRRVAEDRICVNVFLPDRIFESDNDTTKRLALFTYREKWNLLSMGRSIAQLATGALGTTLHCLEEIKDPVFEFSSKKPRT